MSLFPEVMFSISTWRILFLMNFLRYFIVSTESCLLFIIRNIFNYIQILCLVTEYDFFTHVVSQIMLFHWDSWCSWNPSVINECGQVSWTRRVPPLLTPHYSTNPRPGNGVLVCVWHVHTHVFTYLCVYICKRVYNYYTYVHVKWEIQSVILE